jgi:ABC-type branched-subunit amino acid transport system ATPase component
MLSVQSVTAGYGGVPIVHEVSVTADRGEIVAIIGPNGAGKSTLLKSVIGLLGRGSGTILLDGEDVTKLRTDELVERGMAYVPQVRDVFGPLSVNENLEMGAYLVPKSERAARADAVFEMFPALAKRRKQRADTLSGGERKMLAIALVSMMRPKVLLLDEPTANLSSRLGNAFLQEHVARLSGLGVAILLVEQRAIEALAIADKACVIVSGEIVASGPAKDLGDRSEIASLFLGGPAVSVSSKE